MNKKFSQILWGRGVRLRQRVPIPQDNLPENFRKRPFSTKEILRLDAEDFPLEHMRDKAEFFEWMNDNIAFNLGDGIYYIMVYGKCYQHWERRLKRRRIRLKPDKHHGRRAFKYPRPLKVRKYIGIISLAKFEILNGSVTRLFQKRGAQKKYPYSYPDYPIWSLFKNT